MSQILGGAEFYNRSQALVSSGTADERYVQTMYQVLLNRAAGSDKTAAWVNQLPNSGTQGAAATIMASGEFQGGLFETYYNTLLHRSSDPLGIYNDVFSNLDAASLRIGIEGSLEFYNG